MCVERTRQRIAADLHDDIGSKVGTIRVRLDLLGRRARLDATERRNLQDVLTITQQLASDLRDTVWIVHAGHDHLADLVERMHEVTRQLLAGVRFTFEAPWDLPEIQLDMEVRRHLFLVYKEALHNAVRHAGAEHIDVEMAFDDGLFVVTIADDGEGFDPDRVRKGRGLRSMQTRAGECGALLSIESHPGRGTVVRLAVRLARRMALVRAPGPADSGFSS